MNELLIIETESTLSLKEQLDCIDETIKDAAWDGFYWSRLNILVGAWEKGKAVAEYRGVNSATSLRQLERETGRQKESLKKWDDLYEKYPVREEYIEVAKEAARKWTDKVYALSGETKFRIAYTGENEWYTPVQYIEAARLVMGGIDLDPATSEFGQSRIKANKYYTIKEDGLRRNWEGKVWLNPPYSKDLILRFVDKASEELQSQNIKELIVLTHNYTDTLWFHKLEVISPSLLCFTRGRIAFEDQEGNLASPTQGSTFFYFGNNEAKFREVFGEYGFIR